MKQTQNGFYECKEKQAGCQNQITPCRPPPCQFARQQGATLDFCSEKALPGAMNAKNPKDRYVLLKTFDG